VQQLARSMEWLGGLAPRSEGSAAVGGVAYIVHDLPRAGAALLRSWFMAACRPEGRRATTAGAGPALSEQTLEGARIST
jgi:hypothetical protein